METVKDHHLVFQRSFF